MLQQLHFVINLVQVAFNHEAEFEFKVAVT